MWLTSCTNSRSQMLLLLLVSLLHVFTVSCQEEEVTPTVYYELDYADFEVVIHNQDELEPGTDHNSGSLIQPGYFSIIVFLLYLTCFCWHQGMQITRRTDRRRHKQE